MNMSMGFTQQQVFQQMCPLCDQNIGNGMDDEQKEHLVLFGSKKYAKCPNCLFPVESNLMVSYELELWMAAVDGFYIAKKKYASLG